MTTGFTSFSLAAADAVARVEGCQVSARNLRAYANYYNGLRTHRALAKDAPLHRATKLLRTVTALPLLGGLHHQYCRI